ncbi:Gamma-aminobutyric acid (GABA) B receptor [Seminavis robusta]|uniref:Gamma-aminobutyric acid (GABA) B receptor n=1 Tax=Seminavis robusta TaxID=568900 RepID=A0A9N8EF56_9STRA|nr:Gamma-aminobutyric acid (GABA) B receptor [Seminavis robusta]|eukprot:Sro847_g210350.1 Gamma-aminobutyric acid (GABA) B receptor (644) ;mRNA; f:36110-38272
MATPKWYMRPPNREPLDVLRRIYERGFRTIVVTMEYFYLELPAIADAAEALGMNDGEYVWVFTATFEMEAIYHLQQMSSEELKKLGLDSFANVTKLLAGSALIQPVEPHQYRGQDSDPFWHHWHNQNISFVERLNELYVNNTHHYDDNMMDKPAEEDFFQTHRPQTGTAYLYDAVMAIGIGACAAQQEAGGSAVEGARHLKGIQKANFSGATGMVAFDFTRGFRNTRYAETTTLGVFNLYPPGQDDPGNNNHDMASRSFDEAFVLTETIQAITGPGGQEKIYGQRKNATWTQVGPEFVFASGKTTPPLLLRDLPEQNYLSKSLHTTGLTLMSIALLRLDRGAAGQGMYGNPLAVRDGIYHHLRSLFAKLWRIHKVLQFRRRKIDANHVAGPMFVLLAMAIILLTVWTIDHPVTWERVEVNEITGESIGQCSFGDNRIAAGLLASLKLCTAALTCLMAWKTRDIEDIYSESSWIFTLLVLHVQIVALGIPIGVILYNVSTDGFYLGLTMMFWSFPITVFGLLMVPKMVLHYRGDLGPTVKRGGSRGVQVSGVSVAAASHETNTSLGMGDLTHGSSQPHASRNSSMCRSSVMDIVFNRSSPNVQRATGNLVQQGSEDDNEDPSFDGDHQKTTEKEGDEPSCHGDQ